MRLFVFLSSLVLFSWVAVAAEFPVQVSDRSYFRPDSFYPVIIPGAPDPKILALVSEVNPLLLRNSVLQLTSAKDRRAGSRENQAQTLWLESQLRNLGYRVALQCYRVDECNVLAEKPGLSADAVIVTAHLDSVGLPYAGADDNASGVAGLLEIARLLARVPLEKTLRFLITNGEETGLYGSQHYVNLLTPSELITIRWVLVFDMIGSNSNGQFDAETDGPFIPEAEFLITKGLQYSSLRGKVSTPAWGSDHVPFLEKRVPTVLAIEDWDTHSSCYHRSCDLETSLNYSYAAELVKTGLAGVLEKAGAIGFSYGGN